MILLKIILAILTKILHRNYHHYGMMQLLLKKFLFQKKKLGKTTSNCTVFEDSLHGTAAARASGAKVIGITTSFTAEELGPLSASFPDFTDINAIQKTIS